MSFIIACFNEIDHTRKCINSIIKNSPPGRFDFIFIDNGSTDETKQFLPTIPNATIIQNEENIYVNPAWNQGFECLLNENTSDYVCLCNNDIIVGQNWLDSIFSLFEKKRNEFYVPVTNTQPDPPFQGEDEMWNYSLKEKPLMLSYIKEPFVGFCMFMRTVHIPIFYPIPESLKILRGDDWITDSLYSNGIFPARVNNCAAYHFSGATQRGLPVHEIKDNDHKEFDKLYETEYKKRNMKRINEYRSDTVKLL